MKIKARKQKPRFIDELKQARKKCRSIYVELESASHDNSPGAWRHQAIKTLLTIAPMEYPRLTLLLLEVSKAIIQRHDKGAIGYLEIVDDHFKYLIKRETIAKKDRTEFDFQNQAKRIF